MIKEEAAAVGGAEKVMLIGESQGACVALDAALTYSVDVGAVFVSYGQLYSMTPVPTERASMRVGAFVGAGDTTIGPQLALASYGRLVGSGYANKQIHRRRRAATESRPATHASVADTRN